MRQQSKQRVAISQIFGACVLAFTGVALGAHSVAAKPLDKPACEALKREHNTLLESDLKADIKRGHQWAKENLGQLKLEQIGRLFEVEEQLAFRCKGTALMTAVVIPSLRDVVPPKVAATKNAGPRLKTPGGQLRGVRRSFVPVPLKRPALDRTQTVRQQKASDPAKTTAKAKVESVPTAKAKLPEVIRLQQPKSSASPAARSAKARRSKARQIRARKARNRRKRSDAYVPPPVNPGYQPSLSSP